MKTFAFLVMVLFFSVANGQKKKRSEGGGSCRTIKVVYEDGRKVDSFIQEKAFYNKEMKPVRMIGYFKNGSIEYEQKYEYKDNRLFKIAYSDRLGKCTYEYIYDADGNEIERKTYDEKGNFANVTKNEYRQSKLMSSKIFHSGTLIHQQFFFYDSLGNKIKDFQLDRKGDTSAMEICNCETKNVVRCTFTWKHDSIPMRTERYYDEGKKLVKYIQYLGDQMSQTTYDKDGRHPYFEVWRNNKLTTKIYCIYKE